MAEGSTSTKVMELEVISPDRVVYRGKIRSILFPGADGFFGILPRHAPMISLVEPGVTKIVEEGGKTRFLALTRGFMEVREDRLSFVVDAGETAEEIDEARARAALQRAEERLRERAAPDIDIPRAEYAMRRALARLRAKKGTLGTH